MNIISGSAAWVSGCLVCLMLTGAAVAQPAAPSTEAPPLIKIDLTPQQIEANINLLHEFVKSVGLAQPQHVANATVLFAVFQAALKADAEARAKAATAPKDK